MPEKLNKCLALAFFMIMLLATSALAVDTDNDGLDDLVETNSGIYIDQFDTHKT